MPVVKHEPVSRELDVQPAACLKCRRVLEICARVPTLSMRYAADGTEIVGPRGGRIGGRGGGCGHEGDGIGHGAPPPLKTHRLII